MYLISNLKTYLIGAFASSKVTDPPINTSATHTAEPAMPRFRTDDDSSARLTLSDGRELGYAQYGLPMGKPVFYLHGFPGSRLEAAGFDDLCLEVGIRLIAVDRPGMGWSSPHLGRTLLDHSKDIEDLARHLKLDYYSVLGISGGGPYALACAAALPRENLKCVSIICGIGPPDIGMSGAEWVHRLGFPFGLRYAPFSVVRWFWQQDPSARLDLTDERRLDILLQKPVAHEKDLAFVKSDWPRLSLRSGRECFGQGFEGVWQDGKLICTDFGFRIEDIRPNLPVQLWYGKLDTFVPLNHGVQLAARLGTQAHLRIEDETHGSIIINYAKEALDALFRSM